MELIQAHGDTLAALGAQSSLAEKLAVVHRAVRVRHPLVARIAVALHDATTGRLRTFVHSTDGPVPLEFYEARMEDAPELARVLASREGRVVQDLSVYAQGTHEHTRALQAHGFRSSYTLPFWWDGRFEALIFFNARTTGCFGTEILEELDVWGHLVGSLAMSELSAARALLAAVRTTNRLAHLRDPETGAHLDRMARYVRLIARNLARSGRQEMNDEMIEHLFVFAPMHDVGKIGIPDEVLMKPGPLTEPEREVMRRHPAIGRQIVDEILANFGAEHLGHVDLLRQVAESHHELLDGSGYPQGLRAGQVPVAARIAAVADVFDALTSRRPYKEPWPNSAAFAWLERHAPSELDRDCVEALVSAASEVEEIQRTLVDERAPSPGSAPAEGP